MLRARELLGRFGALPHRLERMRVMLIMPLMTTLSSTNSYSSTPLYVLNTTNSPTSSSTGPLSALRSSAGQPFHIGLGYWFFFVEIL